MRPIVSFCGSLTYQLCKYLTTVLKPLTDESRHKLQSTDESFASCFFTETYCSFCHYKRTVNEVIEEVTETTIQIHRNGF